MKYSFNHNKRLFYKGNPNLPRAGLIKSWTQEERDEFERCARDPVYFAKKYIKIINVDRGLIPFDMWDFQEDMINVFSNNRFSICKLPRQSGKTTTVVSFLLHYVLFNKEVSVAILAHKGTTARDILGRLQLAFEYLPSFLKQGVTVWNKGSVQFENESKIIAASTSASTARGGTYNIIFLDEFAFVPNNMQETFFNSTYPTISSGNTTKVIIVSTPNGLNKFYKMWTTAIEKKSSYIPIEIHWNRVPGRDEAWKQETISNTSEEQFRQEFECEFVGSTNTLIYPPKLTSLVYKNPIHIENDTLRIYKQPERGKTYAITVDVARGQSLDASALSVIDVTQIPYEQVATFRDNKISPLMYPTVIYNLASRYNNALILVEVNDIGQQVADILHFEMAYENLLKVEMKGKLGQRIASGFGPSKKLQYGVKTSTAVKRIGCANLKLLVESDKLILLDENTIDELKTFSAHKESFAAEEGNNDDLAMTLVLFAWMASQQYFKDVVANDIRKVLQEEEFKIEEEIVPFGVIIRGNEVKAEKIGKDLWFTPDEFEKQFSAGFNRFW